MKYSAQEVIQFVSEEDVKFIRLAFSDTNGTPKNISILSTEIESAFNAGIKINSDALYYNLEEILLHPDSNTFALLPWRPDHGRVARMYCTLSDAFGNHIKEDARYSLSISPGACDEKTYFTECDFYLFTQDKAPYDDAGFMDMTPLDKCENIRREVCLALESMGVAPIKSCHSFGPGQNRITYKSNSLLSAADDLTTYIITVKTLAQTAGLYASFAHSDTQNTAANQCQIRSEDDSLFATFLPDSNPYIELLKCNGA